MTDLLLDLPEYIQDHIKEITRTSGLPDNDESIEKIAQAWLEKKHIFEDNIKDMDMEELDDFAIDEEKGAIMMTYSGSLINIGPDVDGTRRVEYFSIGLREDVPDTLSSEECELANEVIVNEPAEFKIGPVKKTSPIFKIAVCKDELDKDEEEELLKNASTMIVDDFVEVNKTLMVSTDDIED